MLIAVPGKISVVDRNLIAETINLAQVIPIGDGRDQGTMLEFEFLTSSLSQ